MTYNDMHGVGQQVKPVAITKKMTMKEQLKMYWRFFFEKGEKTPLSDLPQQRVDLAKLFGEQQTGLKASWLGHSSMLINIDGYSILTDPVFERKVSIVGPKRFNKELPLEVEELPAVDIVIVSHDHYDHLNKYSIQKLSGKTGLFVVPFRVGERLKKWGVDDSKIVELKWWAECKVNEKLTIAATPARHFSGRGLFDRNKTLWASWVIITDKHKVFFSGDSGYFKGFKDIGEKYGPFDVAFLECGSYNEGWSNVHMFPEQTVQAFQDLRGKILQPVHWGTFNLALHPWYEPMERATFKAWNNEVELSTPIMGEIVDYEAPVVAKYWWLKEMEKSRNGKVSEELASAYKN